MEPERDPAVEVTGDSKTQNTTDGDALMGYADETLVQEAPSSEEANATYSSLFVSNHPSPTISTLPPDLDDNRLSSTWEIELPAMDKSWEFVEDGQDIHIQDIVKRTRKSKRILEYLVRTKDGRRTTISFDDLLQFPGGPEALDHFESHSASESGQSKLTESNPAMVTLRPARTKKPTRAGYVDFSQVYLSGDDELGMSHTGARPLRKRRLLTGPLSLGRPKPSYIERGSSPSTGESDSDVPRRPKVISKGRTRAARSTAAVRVSYNDTLPAEEEDDESDASSFDQPKKRSRHDRSNHGATRRSDRTGRATANMRELGEEDIPEMNVRNQSKGVPKAVGAKEQFKPLQRSNEFRLRHGQICDTCYEHEDSSERGQLLYCQGCTFSYHQGCIGSRNGRDHLVTKVGDREFVLQCRRCVEIVRKKEPTAPRQAQCAICHQPGKSCNPFRGVKTAREEQKEREENDGEDLIAPVSTDLINNVRNVLFRCTGCFRAFHMHHLPPRLENGVLLGEGEEQNATDRFAEYSQDWMCLDCVNAPNEIGSLVAWRPTDTDEYVPGQTVETICEDEKEYLIKWKNTSYYMSSWMSGAWVWGRTHASMRTAFARKNNGMNLPKMTSVDAIPEDYLRVDIVFDVKYTNVVSERIKNVDLARVKEIESALVKFKGLGYEDVVWEKRADADESERWADFKAAYDDWVEGHYVHLPVAHNMEQHINRVKKQNFAAKVELKEQPSTLTGGTLMEYQMEGLNWLLYQWHRGQNAILADEMGLGKTIQIIAFLTTLQHLHGCWPFLIVVPNATCANWRREIKQWAPSLRVVSYFGPKEARALAQKYELFHGKKAGDLKCHVVVTSYEAAQDEDCQKLFKRIKWAGLVVDEGQKLKNDNNIIYGALSALKMPFKVLLTGTPLQNNQRELFNLLQFLDPSVNAQALEEQYATLTSQNVPELHDLLRPFFLRRTKAQVLTFLPPMAQIIVPVTMTALQKKLYKIIIAKNADLLKSILGANSDKRPSAVKGLRNLLMQLRKCLCHPFVYNLGIEERVANEIVSHRNLVEAASKLQLLEIMLPKLKERGHRVLIFSQFLEMMTMMEDFMDGLGLQHLRLDGTLGSLAKQTVIDKFNAPDSTTFALLLSTRAGGVGINLATADTVIIMDPDFNPHQDIQAISRAHRIGQKKKVLVFQLMTRGSAEERIVQIGKKKMALDHILIERMEADEADGQDLESVLRFGAEALFKDDDSHDIQYDAASVDLLLDRSQMEDTQTGNDKSAESSFGFARVWANEAGTLEDGLGGGSEDETHANPSTWDRILEERARQAALDDAERVMTFGRGKRQRRAIDYTKEALSGLPEVDRSDSDTDFQTRGEDSDGEDSGLEKNQAIDPIEQQDLEPHRSTSMVRETMPKPTPKATSTAATPFHRTIIPLPEATSGLVPKPLPPANGPCLACNFKGGPHPTGHCPLKLAGVENCNLCGLAHFGVGNSCPHLSSETQIRIMLQSLPSSPEDGALVERARRYLNGQKGHLVRQKKLQAEKAQLLKAGANGTAPSAGPSSAAAVGHAHASLPRDGPASPYASPYAMSSAYAQQAAEPWKAGMKLPLMDGSNRWAPNVPPQPTSNGPAKAPVEANMSHPASRPGFGHVADGPRSEQR